MDEFHPMRLVHQGRLVAQFASALSGEGSERFSNLQVKAISLASRHC